MKYHCAQLVFLLVAMLNTLNANAKNAEYVWVIDKQVSSQDVLRSSLSSRVFQMNETQALDTVRKILSRELKMELLKYDNKKQQQTAQTTIDTFLPERIRGRDNIKMADTDYMFMLKVEFRKKSGQTQIFAKAQPIYRVPKKENDENEDTITIKVKADVGQAVVLGPMLVVPVSGQPTDYGKQTLPDAAQRAAYLVRYFMLKLDEQVKGNSLKIKIHVHSNDVAARPINWSADYENENGELSLDMHSDNFVGYPAVGIEFNGEEIVVAGISNKNRFGFFKGQIAFQLSDTQKFKNIVKEIRFIIGYYSWYFYHFTIPNVSPGKYFWRIVNQDRNEIRSAEKGSNSFVVH